MTDTARKSESALATAPRIARAHGAAKRRLAMEQRNATGCACGHVWRPMAWQERTRNVTCPECGRWNRAGEIDIRLRLAMNQEAV